MSFILALPGKYIQRQSAVHEIGKHISVIGDNALIIGGPTALSVSQKAISESMVKENGKIIVAQFNGECSRKEISRLVDVAEKERVNVVVGVGGGKALDTAKAVSFYRRIPLVCVPTIASTDAPCTGVVGVYSERHEYEADIFLRSNPDLVVVDSEIIVGSPVRYLVAGMGDALSTVFEAEACIKSSARNIHGGYATAFAFACAKLCYEIVTEHGLQAKLCAEERTVTTALDKVLEAVILLSGVGFENCGLSVAHGLWTSLTALEEFRKLGVYHGEAVALFTLVQLNLENRPTDLVRKICEFCSSLGLPITLAEIGLEEVSEEFLLQGIKTAFRKGGPIYNVPFPVDPKMIYEAMLFTDSMGRSFKKIQGGAPFSKAKS